MSGWISNLAERVKNSLRNWMGKAKPFPKKQLPFFKKGEASPIETIDLSRRGIGDPSREIGEGLFTRIEIHLTRWAIIVLAVIAIGYILVHTREIFEYAKSPSVTPQANSESEYQKKATSQELAGTRPESAQSQSVEMEQPGNLIDPEFSISLFEKNQSSGLRLCIVNKNPSSTSSLRTGDIFKITFPSECGPIGLIPNSIAVKSAILSATDFKAAINSNKVYLTYVGRDKTFPPWDSCCFDVTVDAFHGLKSGYVYFSASGAGIVKNQPIHMILPSAIFSMNVQRPKTINFEDDYKRYIGSYYPSKPHKKLAKIDHKKQKAKPVAKSEYHRKNGAHAKPVVRKDSKKIAKDKKKAKKHQHS